MKAILMSTQPRWCERIALLKKLLEVRKTIPKLKPPFKVYIYCTKNTKANACHLYINTGYGRRNFGPIEWWRSGKDVVDVNSHLPAYRFDAILAEGKVIGEFICDNILSFPYDEHIGFPTPAYDGDPSFRDCGAGHWITGEELEQTCLSYEELCTYGNGKNLYGLHISDLVIYDEPKPLSAFAKLATSALDENEQLLCDGCDFANWKTERVCTKDFCPERMVQRPPQSWMYVEDMS